jgi:hypothetical protein
VGKVNSSEDGSSPTHLFGCNVFVIERENVKSIEFRIGGKTLYTHADGVYNSVALSEMDPDPGSSYPPELLDRDRRIPPPVSGAQKGPFRRMKN